MDASITSNNILSSRFSKHRYSRQNVIQNYLQKFTNINKSFSMLGNISLKKNRLNLIQYQRENQRVKCDPEMIHAKLRQLQNQAEVKKANYQLSRISKSQNINTNKSRISQHSSSFIFDSQNTYGKIYQSFIKQKPQQQAKYYDSQDQVNQSIVDPMQQNIVGLKYLGQLKKHPKIMDHTIYRMKDKSGQLRNNFIIETKINHKQQINRKVQNGYFQHQIKKQTQRQAVKFIQNPQNVIQRQITKFYLKKNIGKLSNQALHNQRSLSLIQKQKRLVYKIDDHKISKQDKKKLRDRMNDLVNQLAKSDRQKSLQKILRLPKISQNYQNKLQVSKGQINMGKIQTQTNLPYQQQISTQN